MGFKVNFFIIFYGTVLDFAKACQVNLYRVVNMHKHFSFAFYDTAISNIALMSCMYRR